MLDRLPPGARIAFIRLRSLGDCVLTTPALSLLKKHRPDLRVAVVVEDRFAPVFDDNPDVETLLKPEVSSLRKWHPALTINLHGGTRSMKLSAFSGAKYRAGFAHHQGAFLYTHKIPRAQEILGVDRKVHTAEHVASAVFHLGVPQSEVPRARLEKPKGDLILQGRPAVIHPYASSAEKSWPVERFVLVADYIQRHLGLRPIFIPGPGESVTGFGSHRVMANLPIAKLKLVMSQAELFVGNDSGPAHFAAAYGVPSVVLFGPTDPEVWRPWQTEGAALKMEGGIAAIPVTRVIQEVDSLKKVTA
jgi:heptosyltransferase III